MWIHHKNGVIVLVTAQAHITRLLGEGGYEVPDPTLTTIEPEHDEPLTTTDEMPIVRPVIEKQRTKTTRKR